MVKKIFITGGAGYVGTALTNHLIRNGYYVTVYDLFSFGNFFKNNKKLSLVKGDIQDTSKLSKELKNHDCIINLACITSDKNFLLNKESSRKINLEAFEPLVKIAKNNGIKKFINTSSASVYGLTKQKENNEKVKPNPISLYSKINLINENKLNEYSDKNFITTSIRPGSICGISDKMRFDIIVNNFTILALSKKIINVYGGFQKRSCININDLVRLYLKIITTNPKKINTEIFNAGHSNHTIESLAELTRSIIEEKLDYDVSIRYFDTNDIRSYHINSNKLLSFLNFKFVHTIEEAIESIIKKYKDKKIKL